MKEEKQGVKIQSEIVYVSGLLQSGFNYLAPLWSTAGLRGRPPRPVTALSSCLASKGQQIINQSEGKVNVSMLHMAQLCPGAVRRHPWSWRMDRLLFTGINFPSS